MFSILHGASAQLTALRSAARAWARIMRANIAFKYPDAVSHLISLSGAFEIGDFFDGYHDDNIYFNSPLNPSRTSPIRGNSIIWESFWGRESGITPAMNRCACPAS